VVVVLTLVVLVPRQNMQSRLQPLARRITEGDTPRVERPNTPGTAASRQAAPVPAGTNPATAAARPAAVGPAANAAAADAGAAAGAPGAADGGAAAASAGATAGSADGGVRTVTLQLETRPAGASILVDGQPSGTTPQRITLPADGRPRQLRVRLAGYRELLHTFTPDKDGSLVSDLAPLPAAPKKTRPKSIPGMVDPFQ
jgi:hypothetical protein